MRKVGNVMWGIVLIMIGIIWGLNATGITNINLFFHGWWTLFIIIPCFIGLFRNESKTGNIIGLVIGVILLLCAQNILSFDLMLKLILPIILVILGLSMIFGNAIHKAMNQKIKELNKSGLEGYAATFGEQKVNLMNEEFKGANLDAVFGGVELDLRNAKISSDQVINASAIFGGIDIFVPNGVIVKVKSTPIFGGVSNKANIVKEENMPVIYVNAFCLFGGVDIK